MREIEVKLKIDDPEKVVRKIEEQGVLLSAPISQQDRIYSYGTSTVEWEAGKEGHIAVRLRQENGRAIFNLKQRKSNELDNLEYETKVDDAEAIHQILLTMGYIPKVEVKKVRRKGNWRGYEICVDKVESLGAFVELEKLTHDEADPRQVEEELLQALEALGLSRSTQEKRGYDTQIFLKSSDKEKARRT